MSRMELERVCEEPEGGRCHDQMVTNWVWVYFRLQIRRFLTVKGVKFWNGLPSEMVGTKNLNLFKVEVDKVMEGMLC